LGRQFTWANNLQTLTFEKLNRIMVSTEWEVQFPQVMVTTLPRGISDHSPLLLDTGTSSQPNVNSFRLELAWLFKDGFHEKVVEVWQPESQGSTSIKIWQNKIRSLRRYLRGWTKNMNGTYRKEKNDILNKMEQLDKKAEMTMLSPQELDVKHCLKISLMQLLREEEVKWYQRSKANNLLQGDSNTKYFYLVANGKRRKTRIFQLEDGDRIIKGNEPLKSYIMDYYSKLFGPHSGQFS
jgi:hypothetical protein